jgi:CMP-N-acetylneuraminic acid synthetase
MMNQKNIALASNQDLVSSIIAIRRAAKRAAQVAINTDTELIIARNGQNLRVKPNKAQPS